MPGRLREVAAWTVGLVILVIAVGVAVHQRSVAHDWQQLEQHRQSTAERLVADLREQLAAAQSHVQDLQSQLDVAAADGATRRDHIAELAILAESARGVRLRLAACLAAQSDTRTPRCRAAELDAQQVLDDLDHLAGR